MCICVFLFTCCAGRCMCECVTDIQVHSLLLLRIKFCFCCLCRDKSDKKQKRPSQSPIELITSVSYFHPSTLRHCQHQHQHHHRQQHCSPPHCPRCIWYCRFPSTWIQSDIKPVRAHFVKEEEKPWKFRKKPHESRETQVRYSIYCTRTLIYINLHWFIYPKHSW